MIKVMIAAPSSNSGKTTVTCGLLGLLKKQGQDPCSFKCGPDYIDPMFHRSVLGVDSHNLDLHLAGEDGLKNIYRRYAAGHGAVVCEGVMGMYDGIEKDSPLGSAWHVADLLDLPVVLVVKPKGTALTLAAVIKGMKDFQKDSHLAGVVFNDCSRAYYETYAPVVEKAAEVPVLGFVPHLEEAAFGSRHLGLLTAEEIDDIKDRIDILTDRMAETIDLDKLKKACGVPDEEEVRSTLPEGKASGASTEDQEACGKPGEEAEACSRPVLAVARDRAFNFIYEEGLDALRDQGVEIRCFSPLEDEALPEGTCGIYLPGGYPELYAEQLSANRALMEEIKARAEEGMPIVAECGGYMYLAEMLEDDKGRMWPMAALAPGECRNTGKLVRFGYGTLKAREETLLLGKGQTMPEHEFHHWDSTHYGEDLILTKKSTGKQSSSCFATPTVYAGYPHIYFASGDTARRFADAMRDHRKVMTGQWRERGEEK